MPARQAMVVSQREPRDDNVAQQDKVAAAVKSSMRNRRRAST